MAQKRLHIIPKPGEGTRAVLRSDQKAFTFITGVGDLDLLCGECGHRLVQGAGEAISKVVFECTECHSYNDSE